jgi:Xaa-Pro aminopeptidase
VRSDASHEEAPGAGAEAGRRGSAAATTDDAARHQELTRRHEVLAADLAAGGHDALVAAREGNVAYLSGYTTATWSNFSRPVVAVLTADGGLALVVAETEADSVRVRVPQADVRSYVELRPVEAGTGRLPDGRVQFAPHAVEELDALLRELGADSLLVDGLDAVFPPVAQLTGLLGGRSAEDASPLLWRHRLRKSDWELDRMRHACDVLGRAFEALAPELEPGLTEREIHGALAAHAFRAGADGLGYTNVVAGVDRGLFGAPTDRRWQPGEVLYVDGGVVVDGYWADFCRMYTAGEATPAQRDGYARAAGSLSAAVAAFEPGMTAGALAEVIATESGLPPGAVGFGRFGHGIGLYMPEPPSLHPLDDTPLEDGVVLCIEPAVDHDGSNYVVEEEHAVRGGRLERLSPPAPQSLLEVG